MLKFAVFGNPIGQSKSPIIHQAFADSLGISIEYQKVLVPKDDFSARAKQFFRDPAAKGINVTVPFKQDAAQWVDELSQAAKFAGAVNTISRQDGGYRGDNTDGVGLVADLNKHKVQLKGTHILLLGAGGAARGVIKPLLAAGAQHITIANRTESKAHDLTKLFASNKVTATSLQNLNQLAGVIPRFDLIINSTSASLYNSLPGVCDEIIANAQVVYDMVYAQAPTVFLKHARRLGVAHQYDGLGMLVEQAAESFHIWTGLQPDTTAILARLREMP